MEKHENHPIQANRPTAETAAKQPERGQIVVTLIVTVAAIAFLLYVTILVYGLMYRI
ncbi:hypothetical protein [Rhizobium leguminosarum]|uniref:hypothetical protein n=1 Tax=Rhizobium leguminosarum TaxID=384 RepID=UPI00142E31BA|nr:hypothetical protein [Rhizobium leguminosarum]